MYDPLIYKKDSFMFHSIDKSGTDNLQEYKNH